MPAGKNVGALAPGKTDPLINPNPPNPDALAAPPSVEIERFAIVAVAKVFVIFEAMKNPALGLTIAIVSLNKGVHGPMMESPQDAVKTFAVFVKRKNMLD
jgi:hypothetical protein